MRTISQILIDVDNTGSIDDVSSLWNEILVNEDYYPSLEVNFAMEHIADKVKELCKGNIEVLKDMLDILNSHD